MIINNSTTLEEIYNISELKDIKDCLISGGSFFEGENLKLTLGEVHQKNPTWAISDMIFGLERLLNADFRVFELYENNKKKSNVRLIYLPSLNRTEDYCIILLAGGAYGAVCTMAESLPVAARLNEIGADCFCLNYETATLESFENGLLPAPLDDLSKSCQLIINSGEFNYSDYCVCGFSAGGHLASLWGTNILGAEKYNLPRAKAILLAYPLITMEHTPESPLKNYMCTGMFGKNYDLAKIRSFDAGRLADSNFPKTYIVRAENDTTVSVNDANELKASLDKNSVKCVIEEADTGGHGFGLGSETPLSGWVERAVEFIKSKQV